MNEFEKQRRQAARIKESYSPRTRIELLIMDDSYAPVPTGVAYKTCCL